MIKKYINLVLLVCISLRASEYLQLAPCCQTVDCLSQQELEAVKACSKTYNNLVVTNALRTSNLSVTSASTLSGVTSVNGALNVTGSLTVNNLPVAGGLATFASFTNTDPVNAQGTTATVLWSSGGGQTTLSNPANDGFIITSTGTGIITIQNPGTYLYNFGVVLQGAGSVDDQVANAALMLNGSAMSPIGVTTFTIPGNSDPSVIFTAAPYELTSSGLFQTTVANTPLFLSLTLSDSWSMPAAGDGANAYITFIQVN